MKKPIIVIIISFLVVICIIVGIIIIPAIIDDDDDDYTDYNVAVSINEIHIFVNIFTPTFINTNYTLIPTLVDNNLKPINISHIENDFEGEYAYNITLERNQYGWCLNITPLPRSLRIHYNYTPNGAKFYTQSKYDISERFYEDTPAISIWKDNQGSIESSFFCNTETSGFSFAYIRDHGDSIEMHDSDEEHRVERQSGWHNFELHRSVCVADE